MKWEKFGRFFCRDIFIEKANIRVTFCRKAIIVNRTSGLVSDLERTPLPLVKRGVTYSQKQNTLYVLRSPCILTYALLDKSTITVVYNLYTFLLL